MTQSVKTLAPSPPSAPSSRVAYVLWINNVIAMSTEANKKQQQSVHEQLPGRV